MKTAVFIPFLILHIVQLSAQVDFVEEIQNGGKDYQNNTITRLDRPYGLVTSPDDRFLYNACIDDNSVVVFERDLTTGQLAFVESLFANGSDQAGNSISGLFGAINLSVSEDGKHLYVVGLGDNITVFSRNISTGILTFVEALGGAFVPNFDEPVNIGISPDGKSVYVASRGSNTGSITVFSRNAMTGKLTFVESLIDNSTDQAGNSINKIRKPYGVQVSADNKFVYVASSFEASISLFSRDLATGVLTFVDVVSQSGTDQAGNPIGNALFGSNNLGLSPDGAFLYVTAFSNDGIAVFSRNQTTGILTFLQSLENNTLDASGNMVSTLDGPQVLYATNNRLYVATGVGRSLVTFERDATTGLLTFIEAEVDGVGGVSLLNDPEGMTISRDHQFVYATGDEDDGITVFQDAQVPLPVELMYFKGKVEKERITLFWETASEIENEGFFIERSSEFDASKWQQLDFIEGHGNKLSASHYQYTDSNPSAGVTYYRLCQKDFDGSLSYSEVIALSFKIDAPLEVFPNPSQEHLILRGIPNRENASARIFSVTGQLLHSLNVSDHSITISHLPKGYYFLEIQVGSTYHRTSFLKN
ncbi:MAG: beta-propeller fold lactonase family protein [Bacteroidota bacterium]